MSEQGGSEPEGSLPKNSRQLLRNNMRMARFHRGWSQEALALAAGLNRSFIGTIERGECSTTLDTLDKIAHALGLEPYQLLGRLYVASGGAFEQDQPQEQLPP